MNSLTHRMVTLAVHKVLAEDYGLSLPKNPLVWGSIRPDFMKQPVSHFKDARIEVFYEKWDKLCAQGQAAQLENFCIELGEVLHFLCDYFCYAHIEPVLVKDMVKHLKYERMLYKFAKSNDNGRRFFHAAYADYSMLSLREIIEHKHKLYVKKMPSFANDLASGFEMCVITVQKLFEESAITLNYKLA